MSRLAFHECHTHTKREGGSCSAFFPLSSIPLFAAWAALFHLSFSVQGECLFPSSFFTGDEGRFSAFSASFRFPFSGARATVLEHAGVRTVSEFSGFSGT